jgi:hypothetical protein
MPDNSAQFSQMGIHWDALRDVLVVLLFGSVGGAISGAFVANYFTNQRHRKHRKTVLFAFLNVWASEVEANRRTTNRHNVAVGVADQFDERRLVLIEKAAAVELDFGDATRTKFKGLVDKIGTMTPGEVGGEQGRQKLLQAIRHITSFLEES